MEPKFYEIGDTIIRKYGFAQNMVFILSGCVEIMDDFEGNDFVIDRLFMGSTLNQRTFIMQEMVFVTAQCSEPTKTLEISYE